jgi:ribose transport system ATP-binding protein
MNTIVELRNISKSFGGVQALEGVTFRCGVGQVHTVVGQNGAGKSTLMKILAGVYPPDSGEIYFDDNRVSFSSPHDAQAMGVSIIYQEFNLIPDLSVAANVLLGREPRHPFGFLNSSELNRQAMDVLQRLGVDIDPRERVSGLSVAQQQMIEIAKALSLNARVVIMDEPSATLGTRELDRLFEVISALKGHGVAVIYISHRLEEVFRLADWVTVLRDGRLVDTLPIGKVDQTSLVRMMIGSSTFMEQFPPRAESGKTGRDVLRIESLSAPPMLKDIELTVRSGEIVGLAGLMGSGRSELAQVIFGVRYYEKGSIFLEGERVKSPRPRSSIENGMSYLPEDRKEEGLVMELSVLHNSALASMHRRQRLGFITKKVERTAVGKVIQRLNVKTPGLGQEVERLSGGNQQKVVISKWLLCTPNFIIFDEPTRGIDVQAKVEIWKLMRELANRGAAVLMISSELPEIIGMSDRILVMHRGRIAGELSATQASEEVILTIASFGERAEQNSNEREQSHE